MLDGITVHRTGSGSPVLFLHALGVDHQIWDGVTALLKDFTALSYDLPGHGQTPPGPAGFTIADHAAVAAGLLTEAGGGPVDVVGLSLGGLVAQQLAASFPSLVGRLVLVDTVAVYPPQWRERWHERAETARTAGLAALIEPTIDSWFTAAYIRGGGAAVRLVRDLLAAADAEGYARACETLAMADTTQLLGQIEAPTLVVCGREDALMFQESSRQIVNAMPNARSAWLGPGAHAAAIESPIKFVALLDEFLSKA